MPLRQYLPQQHYQRQKQQMKKHLLQKNLRPLHISLQNIHYLQRNQKSYLPNLSQQLHSQMHSLQNLPHLFLKQKHQQQKQKHFLHNTWQNIRYHQLYRPFYLPNFVPQKHYHLLVLPLLKQYSHIHMRHLPYLWLSRRHLLPIEHNILQNSLLVLRLLLLVHRSLLPNLSQGFCSFPHFLPPQWMSLLHVLPFLPHLLPYPTNLLRLFLLRSVFLPHLQEFQVPLAMSNQFVQLLRLHTDLPLRPSLQSFHRVVYRLFDNRLSPLIRVCGLNLNSKQRNRSHPPMQSCQKGCYAVKYI